LPFLSVTFYFAYVIFAGKCVEVTAADVECATLVIIVTLLSYFLPSAVHFVQRKLRHCSSQPNPVNAVKICPKLLPENPWAQFFCCIV
jgi:hypothetical protein